ncbi:Acyltransferase [Actinobaculum suis]|uniref:Acyltransferase n=1 Tax=Actinobaculum suis TaxID=1657 RepID=A0A0K9ETM5_9ACTO|nr:1-acyl-sn-glycerol-3-phosphate acyltransferase [Actinobaculum suis]KMY23206.1 acyltransferase [Actinobaculum suis]MDY5152653.1 1-acyl-sn-glycerol-3-phosphate acyltransferase [Actinobaculum suis]SDE10985.1 Acyltransferase [Actinobaculum suis]VDG75409.1 1-acylglycerol-3-phosphate O-acyltransferases [Actinobaculum suis]
MRFKRGVARLYRAFSRWHFAHEPLPEKVIGIGMPHSSMWDGWFNVMIFWHEGRNMKFLIKKSLLDKPVLGSIIRWAGGIPVDRSHPNGLVGSIVEEAEADPQFTLVLAPEGTRKNVPYLKSGFYRIALETRIPLVLGYVDKENKTYGWWKHMYVSGDIEADMDILRDFYSEKVGVKNNKTIVPRLRAEDDPAAREHLLSNVDLAATRAYAVRMNRETGGVGITE